MFFSNLFADISSNNNTFNARAYRNSGHVLVAIKASEGLHYVNPYHRAWSLHAGLNWVSVVHYHFARPDLGNSPEAEAYHFLSAVGGLAGWWDYLAVDVERATPSGWRADQEWTREFDALIQLRSRFNTILYANRDTLMGGNSWLVNPRKRVWDADYSNSPDFAPHGYECVFRQFTDGIVGPEPHSLDGVGVCDVNRASPAMMNHLTSRYRH